LKHRCWQLIATEKFSVTLSRLLRRQPRPLRLAMPSRYPCHRKRSDHACYDFGGRAPRQLREQNKQCVGVVSRIKRSPGNHKASQRPALARQTPTPRPRTACGLRMTLNLLPAGLPANSTSANGSPALSTRAGSGACLVAMLVVFVRSVIPSICNSPPNGDILESGNLENPWAAHFRSDPLVGVVRHRHPHLHRVRDSSRRRPRPTRRPSAVRPARAAQDFTDSNELQKGFLLGSHQWRVQPVNLGGPRSRVPACILHKRHVAQGAQTLQLRALQVNFERH